MQRWSIETFDFAQNLYMELKKQKNIGVCLKNAQEPVVINY